jgi:outer membrane immunogenic protein
MKRKIAAMAACLASSCAFASAMAADVYAGGSTKDAPDGTYVARAINWSGIYFGGQVGYSNSNHKLSDTETQSVCGEGHVVARDGNCYSWSDVIPGEDNTIAPKANAIPVANAKITTTDVASAFIDGINSHGVFGGGTIGGDLQRGNYVFGVFADYNFSSAKAKAGIVEGVCPNCGTAAASIEDGDNWLIAARAGYLFGDEKRALLYALAGYGQQDVSYHASVNEPGSDPFHKNLTFSGFVVGAGAEYALTQNIFLGLEYQHFFGSDGTIFDSGFLGREADRNRLTDDMSSDKVMAKLKVKFSGDLLGN